MIRDTETNISSRPEIKEPESEILEFGGFRLDVKERLLLDPDGERVQISEKAFATLSILVRRAGNLITKEELLNAVWPDSFIEENNLHKSVHAIRRALGEKPGEQIFIETVKKHGFRFVAEVSRVRLREPATYGNGGIGSQPKASPSTVFEFPRPHEKTGHGENGEVIAFMAHPRESDDRKAASEEKNTGPETAEPRDRSILRLTMFAAAAIVIGAATLGYYFYTNRAVTGTNVKKSIAVLPSRPINSANRDELYEIGIADSLIARLSSTKTVNVRPLDAVRAYTRLDHDPLELGREQKVDYVLASNYQLADGKIKFTAQLINVANGEIEETRQTEKEASDVFAMQQAVSEEIGDIVLARFAVGSGSHKVRRGTDNEEAYRLYLQAMYFYGKRDSAETEKTIELLEEAVRLDPNYPQAWAGKAHAHRSLSAHFGRKGDTHEAHKRSLQAIQRALELDPDLSEAHSALCDNKFTYEWDFKGAETACKRAIELDSNSSLAHQIYARFLMGRGRSDEAIAEIKRAIDLDPASLFNQRLLGNCLWNARRYSEAEIQLKRVIAMDENFATGYVWLTSTLAAQGKEAEAFELLMKLWAGRDEAVIREYRSAYQTSGWQGVLRVRAKRFEEGTENYFQGAAYNAQIGNNDKAFEYLEKSLERHEWGMHILEVDPRFDAIRDDERYKDVLRRISAPPSTS
jgi:DNA-binding winged helix-turn-helix (wHTH) protein/tetratricopeptide (TPR) repeat protein